MQLPLLICLLLFGTVALFGGWAYTATRQRLLAAAGEEMDAAVRGLASGLQTAAGTLVNTVAGVAADPAVVAATRSRGGDVEAALEAVSSKLTSHLSRAAAAELWSRAGERILTSTNPNVPAESEELLEASSPPARPGMRPGIQPMVLIGETATYEVIHEVLADPDDASSALLGYLVLRLRLVSTPEGRNLLGTLVSRGSTVQLGNREGGTWTDLERPVPPPLVDPRTDGALLYEGADGGQRVGAGAAIVGTPWILWAEAPTSSMLRPAHVLLARLGLVSLVLLLMGGAVAWVIGRRVASPLRRATEAAERIARGHFRGRLPEEGPEELARLAEAFNRMAHNVEHRTNELRQARDELEAMYDRGPDLLLAIEVESGRILKCNAAAATRLGVPKDMLVGRNLPDLCAPPSVEVAKGLLQRLKVDGEVENTPLTILDVHRARIPVLLNASAPARFQNGTLESSVSLRDVSDVSQAETRRAAVVRGAMDAIITIDSDGLVMEFNPAAEEMFGYSASEAEGLCLSDLIIPARHRQKHEEGLARARTTGKGPILGQRLEVEAQRRDGSEFPAEITVVKLEGTEALLFTGFVRDLTPLRRAEESLKETQGQLLQAQKLEAIGRLAGGVAHDFNNLLVVIMGYTELLRAATPSDSPVRPMVDEIRSAGERAEKLTQQLLAFGRKQVMQPRAMNLNDAIRRLESVLDRIVREEIERVLKLSPELGTIRADPAQVDQILVNLVANASDAIRRHGRITVETRNVELDEAYAAAHPSVTAGPHVLLSVSDTGHGMDEQTIARIFDPFFSTKGRLGTGLGLATVYGIVRQSGGHIWVYSEPERGTTFKVYFPRVSEHAENLAPSPAAAPAKGGNETILVVEDDAAVGRFVLLALEQQGYRLLHASAAEEALGLLAAHDGAVDLLLSDVVMPGMSGPDLHSRILEVRPGTKVLYMSGYTDDAIVHHGVLDPGTPFLTKPFSVSDLHHKIREILDG